MTQNGGALSSLQPNVIEGASAFPAGGLEQPQWYAVQTRSRHEKKVVMQAQEKGICTFLPMPTEVHRWSDRKKSVQVPLFPGYVFVRIDSSVEARVAVLRTVGVVRFVGIQGHALPIPDKQIEDIRALVDHNIPCTVHPYLRAGQRVRVRGGCLDGVEGIFVTQNSDKSLIVSIELIQKSVAVRIAGYDVQPA